MPKKRGTDEADYTVISDDSLNIDKDTSQSDISQYSEHSGPQQYRVGIQISLTLLHSEKPNCMQFWSF